MPFKLDVALGAETEYLADSNRSGFPRHWGSNPTAVTARFDRPASATVGHVGGPAVDTVLQASEGDQVFRHGPEFVLGDLDPVAVEGVGVEFCRWS